MTSLPTEKLLATLKRALASAGPILRRSINHARISKKGPIDLVTTADKAAEKTIVRTILRAFPDHGILTEESKERPGASEFQWIIDPIDGTTNFAHGIPHASVSIGVQCRGQVILGAVLDPFRPELYLAARGRGATLNGEKIRVSKTRALIDSLLVTGFPYVREQKARFYLGIYEKFMVRTRGVRRFGSAALDLAYVAAGRFDGYWEFHLKAWDVAAGILLVREAGGTVTDFAGRPPRLGRNEETLATNGPIHPLMLKFLRDPARRRTVRHND